MLKLIGAALAMVATSAGGGDDHAASPIYLSSQPVEGGMRFQVIGAPASRYEATFVLEVSSSGNQSRHQGSASLEGGEHATLSSVTVGVSGNSEWRARLRVEPVGAAPYEQVLTSSGS